MSEDRGERRPRPRGGRRPRRKVCSFCVDKIEYIDYKDINRLRCSGFSGAVFEMKWRARNIESRAKNGE